MKNITKYAISAAIFTAAIGITAAAIGLDMPTAAAAAAATVGGSVLAVRKPQAVPA